MNAPGKAVKNLGQGWSATPNGQDGDFEIASKMQAGNIDPTVEADRKESHRRRRGKGRVEERVSTGTENADALPSIDLALDKTGTREQRSSRHAGPGCRVLAVHAGCENGLFRRSLGFGSTE